MISRKLGTGLAWLLVAMVLNVTPRVRADAGVASVAASVATEVLIVLGSSEGTDVDAELRPLAALTKAPFDGFTRKTLLKRVELHLQLGKDSEITLPNGRILRLSLAEKLADGRLRLRVAINRTGERDYLPLMTVTAAPGDPFFIAGQKYGGGTLILGVRVVKPHG